MKMMELIIGRVTLIVGCNLQRIFSGKFGSTSGHPEIVQR
jgi:hypothetical protein